MMSRSHPSQFASRSFAPRHRSKRLLTILALFSFLLAFAPFTVQAAASAAASQQDLPAEYAAQAWVGFPSQSTSVPVFVFYSFGRLGIKIHHLLTEQVIHHF